MAYTFGGTAYLRATVSGYTLAPFPMTLSAWVKVGSLSATNTVLATQELSATATKNFIAIQGSSGYGAVQSAGATSTGTALTTTSAATVGTWVHLLGVFASQSSRTAYLSNISATDTTNVGTMSNQTDVSVGARYSASAWGLVIPSGGAVADAAVWSAALSADEILSLSKAVSPELVRPQSLVFYAPLQRNLIDARYGLSISNVNTATPSDHPRVYA